MSDEPVEIIHLHRLTRTRDRRPSRAPDSDCGAADFLFDLIDGGGGRTGRARRWHGQQADRRIRRPDRVSDVCSLRDSRLARSRPLSVGGAARGAAGFLFGICHGRRATGSTSPPAACTGKVMGLGRVLAPRFQAGTIAPFIRWRGGARRRRISFWHLPWPPSYGVDVAAGGLHRQGDGSRTCARSEIPGWHDRALYPLAGRRAAPPDFFLAFAMAAELRGRRRRRRLAPAR